METATLIIKIIYYVFIVAVFVIGILKMLKNEEKSVKEWLLLAVTEAEKALGGGTGKLKLRQTFQAFVSTFPVFSKFISYETFEGWVDEALDDMRHLLETNDNIAGYVKGE